MKRELLLDIKLRNAGKLENNLSIIEAETKMDKKYYVKQTQVERCKGESIY